MGQSGLEGMIDQYINRKFYFSVKHLFTFHEDYRINSAVDQSCHHWQGRKTNVCVQLF